jgi:hypothetical protein
VKIYITNKRPRELAEIAHTCNSRVSFSLPFRVPGWLIGICRSEIEEKKEMIGDNQPFRERTLPVEYKVHPWAGQAGSSKRSRRTKREIFPHLRPVTAGIPRQKISLLFLPHWFPSKGFGGGKNQSRVLHN